MAENTRIIQLKGKQALFAQSKARYTAIFGGVGSGKTMVCSLVGIDMCLRYPGITGAVIRKSVPELRLSVKKRFMDLLHDMDRGRPVGQKIIESENDQLGIVKFKNGSTVYFLHTQSEGLYRGPEFGWFLIDQAEELDEDIVMKIMTRLRQPGYPHRGMFNGNTDKGHNWCYRWFKLGQLPNSELFEVTYLDNIDNLDKDDIEDMLSRPEDWKKVYLFGSWDSPGGLVLNLQDIHFLEPFDIPAAFPRYIALDPAESTGTCAALAFTVDRHGNYIFVKEYYRSKCLIKEHAEGILKLWDGMHKLIVADPNSWRKRQAMESEFVTIADRYSQYGIFAVPANGNIEVSIDILRELAEPYPEHLHPVTGKSPAPRIYFFKSRLPNLMEEIKSWMIEDPTKEPCHAVSALRYAVSSGLGGPDVRKRIKPIRVVKSFMGL